jgi:hypothetical protein
MSFTRRMALSLALAAAGLGVARAQVDPPTSDADAAQADYVERLRGLAAQRAPELEAAAHDAFDRAPCVRAELAVWVVIAADGAVTEARPDDASGHPSEVRDAVAAKVKTWKLPPPPGGRPARLRLPLGVLPAAPIPARLACDAALLDAGDYHVTQLEPGIERGKWRAVCAAEARPVKVALKRFRDVDDDADEKTGRRVSAKGCDAPAFLFQNLPSVADGPLLTGKAERKGDGWDTAYEISLGAVSYGVRVVPRTKATTGDEPRPWRLVLETAGLEVAQELDVGASARPPALAVRWAGDLDADGRPDFALEERDDGDGGVTLRLYLSGAARAGRAVRQVASTARGGK